MSIGPSAAWGSSRSTAGPALPDVARILAEQGGAGLPTALEIVAASIGCDHVVLKAADTTTVLAAAGAPAGPKGRRSVLDIPVRQVGDVHGVLSVTSRRAFTAADARFLAAVADLVGLALRADGFASAWSVGREVLDGEADRADVAATLLDGVGEALVSVRYGAELVAAGRAEASELDEPVRAALAAVRHAHRDLRAHALESGLRVALKELPERWGGDRPDDGLSELRISVDAEDPRLDAVAPPVAVTVQRVAEAALRGASGRAEVSAGCDGKTVKLCVESAEIAYDASELNRWGRRARALGGDLRLRPDGVELSLPAALRPDGTTPQREGHHDDGSDL